MTLPPPSLSPSLPHVTVALKHIVLAYHFGIFFYWQLLTDSELDILGVFIVLVS